MWRACLGGVFFIFWKYVRVLHTPKYMVELPLYTRTYLDVVSVVIDIIVESLFWGGCFLLNKSIYLYIRVLSYAILRSKW